MSARRLLWVVGLLFLAVGLLLALNPRRCIDFTVFRTAGARWLAGTSLYRAEDAPMPFKYAPPVAVLLAPLALVPRAVGAVLWNAASVLLLMAALVRLPRVDPAASEADGSWAALALAGPIGAVLFYGQVDLLLLGLLVLAAAAVQARDGGGTALALSVLTKPPSLLAGLFFVGRRRWGALAVAAGIILLVCATFALRAGLAGLVGETSAWRALVERTTLEWVTGPNPQGLPTLLLDVAGWFDLGPTAAAMMLAQLLAMLVFAALVLALREEPGTAFRMTCLAIALCSPLAWRANFVLALPSLRRQVAAAREGYRRSAVLLGLVIVLSVLTSGLFLDRTATERILGFRPWGLLGLLLVAVEFSPRLSGRSVRDGAPPG